MKPPQFYNKSEQLVVESGALITYFNSNCDVMAFSNMSYSPYLAFSSASRSILWFVNHYECK